MSKGSGFKSQHFFLLIFKSCSQGPGGGGTCPFNLNTQEAQAGGSTQPGLHSEFSDGQDYTEKPCQ